MNQIEKQKCTLLAERISQITKISTEVKNAIANTSRTAFVPPFADAFSLDAHAIGNEQWISSPLTVAKMSEALQPKGALSALEIGCGSGYQAAILAKIIKKVFTIERIENLANSAKARFKELGINNIFVRFDDGNVGWSSYAPFDRIIFSCACKEVPAAIFSQLKDGGILVAPVQNGSKQYITQFFKSKNNIRSVLLEECDFVPLLSGRA